MDTPEFDFCCCFFKQINYFHKHYISCVNAPAKDLRFYSDRRPCVSQSGTVQHESIDNICDFLRKAHHAVL